MRIYTAVVVAVILGSSVEVRAQEAANSSQRPVNQQDIDRLRRQIDQEDRSSVEAIVDYHTETGDLNSRLNFFRYGGRLNLRTGASTAVQFTGTRTNYLPLDSAFREQGTNFTAGIQTRISDSVEAHVEGGATRFSTDTTSLNALASLSFSPDDNLRLYATASRGNVEESLLSATGIRPVVGPFAGQLVGRVAENRFVGGGFVRLPLGVDVSAEGGAGTRVGNNVPSNVFRILNAAAGYGILTRPDGEPLTLLRAAYEFSYSGFDSNRFGYGGASLLTRGGLPIARIGSDGISPNPGTNTPGVGGYFSPKNFVGNVGRIEARGGSDARVSYSASAFLGTQVYTGASARLAKGVSATVTAAINDRVSIPVTYFIDNFGPFTQQALLTRLAVRF